MAGELQNRLQSEGTQAQLMMDSLHEILSKVDSRYMPRFMRIPGNAS